MLSNGGEGCPSKRAQANSAAGALVKEKQCSGNLDHKLNADRVPLMTSTSKLVAQVKKKPSGYPGCAREGNTGCKIK